MDNMEDSDLFVVPDTLLVPSSVLVVLLEVLGKSVSSFIYCA